MIKSVAGSYAIYYPPHAIHQQLNAPNYKYTRWLITIEPAYLDGLDFPDSTFVLNLTADNLRRLVEPAKLLLFYSGDEKNVDRKLVEARRRSIVGLMLTELKDSLKEKAIELSWTDDVLKYLAEKSVGGKRGARDLRSVIRKEIEDKIATIIIDNAETPVSAIAITAADGKVELDVL